MIEVVCQVWLLECEVVGGVVQELEDIDIDEEIFWELVSFESGSFYVWVVGELVVVMVIWCYLVQECGIDKCYLILMGYWCLGKVFD